MKHKHYEMIVAKAANMDLVVLAKSICDKVTGKPVKWSELWKINEMSWLVDDSRELFLCLPQHKEACLHWLNGGSLQDFFEDSWTSVDDFEGESWVEADNMFMNEEYQFKVKPKKEKRWIAVNPDGYVMPIHTDSIESARAHACHDTTRLTLGVQFIEIEVEV